MNNGVGGFINLVTLVERCPVNYSPSQVLRVFQYIGIEIYTNSSMNSALNSHSVLTYAWNS
jgi:hypothetical protein